jgi:hypothetical protein
MLIVCTHDQNIIDWTLDPNSGANSWGNIYVLNGRNNQRQATLELQHLLDALAPGEPLCLSAHGNDEEIGDEGNGRGEWGWTSNDIAAMLPATQQHYPGVILIRACARQVSNFSAHLAVALQDMRKLNHLWIYGYNVAIDIDQHYPAPNVLNQRRDLQGSQVNYMMKETV